MHLKYTKLYTGSCFLQCTGREPFAPKKNTLPFMVYFSSRYRGLCSGILVSRTAVLTAAVCVTNPTQANYRDRRAINVVTGTHYRHPRRGIRVQVTAILLPNLQHVEIENKGYLMQKAVAILLLKRKVPDILAEVPQRAINIDYKGEEVLVLQEECMMPGWHFFSKEDKIYPVHKFLLQRTIRAQFLNVVKKNLWCEPLSIKFQKALSNLGFMGYIDRSAVICVRDTDNMAQPCHGMYGSPLICRGRAVGMMMAPDAQWTNCTGHSNMIHVFSSSYLRKFMSCVSSLFEPDLQSVDWSAMKKAMYEDDPNAYDYLPALYDKLLETSSTEEDFQDDNDDS